MARKKKPTPPSEAEVADARLALVRALRARNEDEHREAGRMVTAAGAALDAILMRPADYPGIIAEIEMIRLPSPLRPLGEFTREYAAGVQPSDEVMAQKARRRHEQEMLAQTVERAEGRSA
jgi:hypothetical protein